MWCALSTPYFLTKVYLHLLKFPLPIRLPQVKEWITRGACATSPSTTFPSLTLPSLWHLTLRLTFNHGCSQLHPSWSTMAPDACPWVTVNKAVAFSSCPDFSAMCFLAVWEGAVVKTSLIKFARWVGGFRGVLVIISLIAATKWRSTRGDTSNVHGNAALSVCSRTAEALSNLYRLIGQRFSLQSKGKSPQIQLNFAQFLIFSFIFRLNHPISKYLKK